MILPDVNVLIYAFRADAPQHSQYHRWLEQVISADAPYGLSPQVLSSVIRISTNPRVYRQPSEIQEALAFFAE